MKHDAVADSRRRRPPRTGQPTRRRPSARRRDRRACTPRAPASAAAQHAQGIGEHDTAAPTAAPRTAAPAHRSGMMTAVRAWPARRARLGIGEERDVARSGLIETGDAQDLDGAVALERAAQAGGRSASVTAEALSRAADRDAIEERRERSQPRRDESRSTSFARRSLKSMAERRSASGSLGRVVQATTSRPCRAPRTRDNGRRRGRRSSSRPRWVRGRG